MGVGYMLTVTKEFKWDMAHILAGHEGMCKNLHGHTYRMQVEVARKSNDLIKEDKATSSMVIDFKDLKKIVKEEIVEALDHAFMYWTNSPDKLEHKIADLLKEEGRKVVEVDFRPTAEAMSFYFLNILKQRFKELNIKIISVKVWETPTSYAEAKGEI